MTSREALILVNGTLADPQVIRARLASCSFGLVIAVDGGSRHARTLNLMPQAVIGDLDSLDAGLRAEYSAAGVVFEVSPARKDETDLELAIGYARGHGAERIVLIGAVGGRLDMTLANLLLLTHPAFTALHIEAWDGSQTAWLLRPPGEEIAGSAGDTVSLIPLGGDAAGVRTHGMEYPLRGETLAFGPARGISNVMMEGQARIDLASGLLLLVHTPGRA